MTTLPALRRPLLATLAAPFRLFWEGMMALALAGPRVEALERLSQLSDAELAARGTTRVAQVERILGVRSLV